MKNKFVKFLICVLVIICLVCTLVACGDKNKDKDKDSSGSKPGSSVVNPDDGTGTKPNPSDGDNGSSTTPDDGSSTTPDDGDNDGPTGPVAIPTTVNYDDTSYLDMFELDPSNSKAIKRLKADYAETPYIVIPNGIEVVKSSAFSGAKVKAIFIAKSVKELEYDSTLRMNNDRLERIEVESGNEKYKAVNNCLIGIESKKLISGCNDSVIPANEGIETIVCYAFDNAKGLKELVVPEGVKEISWNAFNRCENLESVSLPNTLKTIMHSVFSFCTSLKSIVIPDSVDRMDSSIFYKCESLESVTIPHMNDASVWNDPPKPMSYFFDVIPSTSRGEFTPGGQAGTWYANLVKNITITNCHSLVAGGFYGFDKLETLTITGDEAVLGRNSLTGCVAKTLKIPYYGESKFHARDYVFGYLFGNIYSNAVDFGYNSNVPAGIENVIIGDMPVIGGEAFKGCENLKSIQLPDTTTTIGASVFEGCSKLEKIVVPFIGEDESHLKALSYLFGGANFSENDTKVPATLKEVEIAKGSKVDDYVFRSSNVVKVTLPSTIEEIGSDAFYNCFKLEEINLPEGLKSIGSSAFGNCTSLVNITIPDTLTTLSSAFSGCSALEGVKLPKGLTSISSEAFLGCGALKSIVVDEQNERYASVNNCLVDKTNKVLMAGCADSTIPTSADVVTVIGYSAFSGRKTMEAISIPSNIVRIGGSAFSSCTALARVELAEGLEEIGYYAFASTAITEIVIPSTVVKIDSKAFARTNLTSLTIPASVVQLGGGIVGGCESLTTIVLENKANWHSTEDSVAWSEMRNGKALEGDNVEAQIAQILKEEHGAIVYLYSKEASDDDENNQQSDEPNHSNPEDQDAPVDAPVDALEQE